MIAGRGVRGAGRENADSATVGDLVGKVAAVLAAAGIPGATAEARELIAALNDAPRFWAAANGNVGVDDEDREHALRAAEKRAAGAPLAYAVGRASFRHLVLDVDERVLIPRPETEQLVDLVLEFDRDIGGVLVDVGTGSGAIAIALACEGRYDRVIGVDVSADALDVARGNAEALEHLTRCPVEMRLGSLLEPVASLQPRVIVSNPPYIAFAEAPELPASVRDWEPPVALFAADEGMAAIRQLVAAAAAVLPAGGLLVMEVDSRRAHDAAAAARATGAFGEVIVKADLFGRDRFVAARVSLGE